MAAEQKSESPTLPSLKEAVREARIEAAERSGVVVDLRDAELARLELLNEALDPLFAEIPDTVSLFDRGISQGTTPRLWIDVIAHVEMGRDKRLYRFLQDTRFGRKVLKESYDVVDITAAVTRYVARRMVERDRAFVIEGEGETVTSPRSAEGAQPKRWPAIITLLLGAAVAVAALVVLAKLGAPR